MTTQHAAEQAIAHDLDRCDLGIALTTGKARKRYQAHRAECFKAIHAMNVRDGLDKLTPEERRALRQKLSPR